MKINDFWDDLNDISANKQPLTMAVSIKKFHKETLGTHKTIIRIPAYAQNRALRGIQAALETTTLKSKAPIIYYAFNRNA